MYKVIIVDDEPFVIEGLVEMVSWERHGFKVSGMASDGESALELIKTIQPDVVFTDIRMPGMDGLALMDETRRLIGKEILFVVLSGYTEFDYIKKAMDLKSFTYLLKPIDSDAINDELVKIKGKLDEKAKISERLQEGIDVVLSMTLERLSEGQMKPSLVGRAKFLMDIGLDDGYFMGVTSSQKAIEAFMVDTKMHHLFYRVQDKDWYFIVWGNKHGLEENLGNYEVYNIDGNEDAYVYVTQVHSSLLDINTCYQILDSHQRNRFYDRPTYKIVTEHISFSKDIDRISKNPLFRHMNELNQSELEFQLNHMFHNFREKRLSPDVLKLKFEVFIDWMQHQLNLTYTYENFNDFRDFKRVCKEAILYYFKQKKDCNDVVDLIHEYVYRHMDGDLRLKTVAQLFGYNPVYLGQIFQKDMGLKYKDFINRIRMEKAKELLLYSGLRVKEVADEIGFNNPDYFVKKFKESEGVSPSEYRI